MGFNGQQQQEVCESLNITMAQSMTSQRVMMELSNLIAWRGKPLRIRVDGGPDFIADGDDPFCGGGFKQEK